jgi:hypothetical protein
MGISKQIESAYNTQYELASDYVALVTSAFNISLPTLGKFFDGGLIGSGSEYARVATPDYLAHPSLTITDRVNTDLAAMLFKRCLGGPATDTAVTSTTSYDHSFVADPASDDPALPSSSIAVKMGGLDLLLSGCVVNSYSVSFSDAAAPTFSAQIVGSGKFKYMSAVTPTPLVLPAYTAQNYMGTSAGVVCSLNDGTVLNLSQLGRLKAFNFSYSNNLITGDRRSGDPLTDPTDINSGAYVNRLTRGIRSCSASIQVYVDQNKREWADHLANTPITAFSWKAQGQKLNTTDSNEFEVKIPKSVFTNASVSDSGGKLILSLDMTPLLDVSGGQVGLATGRVRNGIATLV